MATARDVLRQICRLRSRSNYKGCLGRIGIVGGARDYAGAPYFASMASMRLGADLAYVICSQSASQAIKSYSPDLIVSPLLDCPSDREFSKAIDCLMTRLHALVIGPGLGLEASLQSRASQLIEKAKSKSIPLILDADSIAMVMENPDLIKSYPKALLTPNRIELQRMLNKFYSPKTFDLRNTPTEEIRQLVSQLSSYLEVSILAKGSVDIINEHPSGYSISTEESIGSDRRCGGQGDILAGLAGVFIHWIERFNQEFASERIKNPIAWTGYLAAATTRIANDLAFKEHKHGMLTSHMLDKLHEALASQQEGTVDGPGNKNLGSIKFDYHGSLSKDEIERYRRQMIMAEFGPERQVRLKKASVLIIGAGGLGCPAAIYLAAGGVGRLGLVDDDHVEASNLHRQILHSMAKVGWKKTDSIKESVLSVNPNVKVDTYEIRLSRHNAVDIIEKYDIVVDATDNLLTRYMISDACVVAGKPLVSGAALKMDGQLTVYNLDMETPCFRCLFPEPPPPNAVGSCADNGVLGVIPGIIGVQQALEALKIGAGLKPAYAGKMLLFDGQLGLFRHIQLNKRRPNCEACGSDSHLGRELIDYEQFCGTVLQCSTTNSSKPASDILEPGERITVEQYRTLLESGKPHVLVDVRPLEHSEVSRLKHALALPVIKLMSEQEQCAQRIKEELQSDGAKEIYVVCRRGIASQRGTRLIQEIVRDLEPSVGPISVRDIIGGMTAWSERIDPENYSCL